MSWNAYLDERAHPDSVVYYVQVFDNDGETWRNVGSWSQHADAVRGYARARVNYRKSEIEEWEAREAHGSR